MRHSSFLVLATIFSKFSMSGADLLNCPTNPVHLDRSKHLFKIEDLKGQESYILGSYHDSTTLFIQETVREPLKLLDKVTSFYYTSDSNHHELQQILAYDQPQDFLCLESILGQSTYHYWVDLIVKFDLMSIKDIKNLSIQQFKLLSAYIFTHKILKKELDHIGKTLLIQAHNKGKITDTLEVSANKNSHFKTQTTEEAIKFINSLREISSFYQNQEPLWRTFNNMIFSLSEHQERYLNGAPPMPSIVELFDKDNNTIPQNQYIFPKMKKIISEEQALFVVGMKNLHGESGLLKMFIDNGYQVSEISDKTGREKVGTLQRQIKPVFISAGLLLTVSHHIIEAYKAINPYARNQHGLAALLYSSLMLLIWNGIYDRTNFLFTKNTFFTTSNTKSKCMTAEDHSFSTEF